MTTLYDVSLDPFRDAFDSNYSSLTKSLGGSHAERLQAIFREHPNIKASVEDGTMNIWFDEEGREHWEVLKTAKRFSKASDSPITAELIESQLPDFDLAGPLFKVGGVSIAAGSTKDFTFAVNPLSLGQHIEVAPVAPLSDTWAGIVWKTWVSAINEITFRIANVTNSTLKPAVQGFFEIAGASMHSKAGSWRGALAKHGPVEYMRDEFEARVRFAVTMANFRPVEDGEPVKDSCGI
jgi:hypothetical protein